MIHKTNWMLKHVLSDNKSNQMYLWYWNSYKEQTRKYKRYGKVIGIYFRKDLNLLIIMDCRTTTPVEFRTKLGFKQQDIIMTKENQC